MSTNNRGLVKGYTAGGACTKYRIGKFGASDGVALQAAAATDLLVGVFTDVGAATGEPVDMVRSGITPVDYGGNVTRGQKLTADANGKAIAITLPAQAASVQVIGIAEESGVDGDIGSVLIQPSTIYGGSAA